MKIRHLLQIALLFSSIVLKGQSVIIGTGTLTTNGNIADPIERYYQYERFQIVYTAAELSAAGMPAGAVLTGLGFSVSQSAVTLLNYTIDLGLTTQATADPCISSGLVNVRTPFSYFPVVQAAGSFDMISFTSYFVWDGISNLVINTCTGPNAFVTPYGGLRYTAAANGSVRFIRNDGQNYCAITTVENSTFRPNIRIDYTPGNGECFGAPNPGSTLSTENPACSGESFELSLENSIYGTGVTYQWQSSADGITNWINIGSSQPTCLAEQTFDTWYHCLVTCQGVTTASSSLLVGMNWFEEFTQAEGILSDYACYSATHTVSVSGAGTPFQVTPDGVADMIAGIRIALLPGTMVEAGGYLGGIIAPCGPYCDPPAKRPLAGFRSQTAPATTGKFFVHPNPSHGNFTIEPSGFPAPGIRDIILYDLQGICRYSETLTGKTRHTCAIGGVPPGVYLLLLLTDDGPLHLKIIIE